MKQKKVKKMSREDKIVTWNICESILNGVLNNKEYITYDKDNQPMYQFDESGHCDGTLKEDLIAQLHSILDALDVELNNN